MNPVVCALATVAPLTKILFIGNSHTRANDMVGMVRSLLQSDGSGRRAQTQIRGTAFLEDAAISPNFELMKNGKWDVIVLQGAKLSSSHKYDYPHDGSVSLAKAALASGAKTWLFAEWPRRGWDETAYILKEYGEISKASNVPVLPVCKVFDAVRKGRPKLELLSGDGNHANVTGSFLTACFIYCTVFGQEHRPKWAPESVSGENAKYLYQVAAKSAAR